MNVVETIKQFAGETALVDIVICFAGMSIFSYWLLNSSLGRKSLAGSRPRLNIMPVYLPFIPLFIWFGRARSAQYGDEVKDPPWNMQLAMALTAALTLAVGMFPNLLQSLLPYSEVSRVYSAAHVSHTLQLLAATAIGFYILRRALVPKPGILLDVDWLYRRGAAQVMRLCAGPLNRLNDWVGELYQRVGVGPVQQASGVLTRFDRSGIDGLIDGLARHTLVIGDGLRRIQTGKIQHYIGAAVIFFFLLMIIVMLY